LNSKNAYSVKTHEEAIILQSDMQTIGMINPIAIESHLKSNYRFMHIGLVQVAIKPLLKTGVNAPIYLALRDKRLRHYKSSLLAVVQTTLLRVWHLVKGGSVSAIHPPVDNLTFLLEDVAILATPFRKGREGDTTITCADLQKVHQQFNYTNTAISTIATQLNHVANRVEATEEQIPSASGNADNYANSISKPFFKVESISRKDQDDFTAAFSNASLLKQISQQIKALDLPSPSTSCLDKTCAQISKDTIASETEEADEEIKSEEEALPVLTKTFEEDTSLAINKN